MPRDEPVSLPLEVRLLLQITALSLRLKSQERDIAELRDRLATLEAAHAK
jgi:hypothetical protein